MSRIDGRITDIVNRFCIEKPEGVHLIPWATRVATDWKENGAQFKAETGWDYPKLEKVLASVYAETKKRPDAAEVLRFSALSQNMPMPALEKAMRESASSELDMIEPGSIGDVKLQQEAAKFLAEKGHSTVVAEWIKRQQPMYFAAQKSRAVGDDCTMRDWLEANWRAETSKDRV